MTVRPDPITVEDQRDYAKRHDIKGIQEMPEEELQAVVDAGNKKEQEFYDEKETRRKSAEDLSQKETTED